MTVLFFSTRQKDVELYMCIGSASPLGKPLFVFVY